MKSLEKGKNRVCGLLLGALLFLSPLGCGGKKIPTPDGPYFDLKTKTLTQNLIRGYDRKMLGKVALMDITNADGNVSLLGRYVRFKLSQSFLKSRFLKKLIPRGEIMEVMVKQNLEPTSDLGSAKAKKLGELLGANTLVMGEIVDTGLKISLNLKLVETLEGKVVSFASVEIERTREMLKMYKTL